MGITPLLTAATRTHQALLARHYAIGFLFRRRWTNDSERQLERDALQAGSAHRRHPRRLLFVFGLDEQRGIERWACVMVRK